MPKTDIKRKLRCKKIIEYLYLDPFVTDKKLSEYFDVSVNTIRLDRRRLGIREVKDRIKEKACENMDKVTSIEKNEFVGNMLEFIPKETAKAEFMTKDYMTFSKTNVVKGQYIYSFAESIAIALIPMNAALVGVANIKFFEKIYANMKIIATAQVRKKTKTGYLVWVRITDLEEHIKFRGKYILKGIE